MFLLLSVVNVYLVWLIIELIFIFFLLLVVDIEYKSLGLIIYFFFQGVASLLLFVVICFSLDKIIFMFLVGKLGLFPFFYWIVVVRVKVGLVGNMFVLSLQKVSVFWLFWLVRRVQLRFLFFLVYLSIFFVIVSLFLVRDLWLLIVYSSIGNRRMIILRVYGSSYMYIVILYLGVILGIIVFMKNSDSYLELVVVVFFFLVIPPFILFFMKFYVVFSLDFLVKVGFFLVVFDVLVLVYYFRLVFIKFMLMDLGILIYMMNVVLLLLMLIFRS
jgi:hypothetical protein